MKEMMRLNDRQKELIQQAGGIVHAHDDYTDTEIEAIMEKVAALYMTSVDAEENLTPLGIELEDLLDYLKTLPVQLESEAEFLAVMEKDYDLVVRYEQKVFIIEHGKKGYTLFEKGRISTRKTFANLETALAEFSVGTAKLGEVLLELEIIDLLMSEEALKALR